MKIKKESFSNSCYLLQAEKSYFSPIIKLKDGQDKDKEVILFTTHLKKIRLKYYSYWFLKNVICTPVCKVNNWQ